MCEISSQELTLTSVYYDVRKPPRQVLKFLLMFFSSILVLQFTFLRSIRFDRVNHRKSYRNPEQEEHDQHSSNALNFSSTGSEKLKLEGFYLNEIVIELFLLLNTLSDSIFDELKSWYDLFQRKKHVTCGAGIWNTWLHRFQVPSYIPLLLNNLIIASITGTLLYTFLFYVASESLALYEDVGLQLEGYSYFGLQCYHRFIPWDRIHGVYINENFHRFQVIYVLCIVWRDSTSHIRTSVAFQETLPRIALLQKVYKRLQYSLCHSEECSYSVPSTKAP